MILKNKNVKNKNIKNKKKNQNILLQMKCNIKVKLTKNKIFKDC